MKAVVAIRDEYADWPPLENLDAFTVRAIDAALVHADRALKRDVEVSVLYCNDTFMRDLNRRWREKDSPTNVLSFPAWPGPDLHRAPALGDIVVSCDTVVREAQDEGKSFADHLAHMLVHGALHLVGFDHENDDDAEAMEALERVALASLGIADPYADAAD